MNYPGQLGKRMMTANQPLLNSAEVGRLETDHTLKSANGAQVATRSGWHRARAARSKVDRDSRRKTNWIPAAPLRPRVGSGRSIATRHRRTVRLERLAASLSTIRHNGGLF